MMRNQLEAIVNLRRHRFSKVTDSKARNMSDPKTLDDDLTAIRALAEVLDDTGLTEIEIERGDVRLRISKNITSTAVSIGAPSAGQALPAVTAAGPTASPSPESQDLSNHPGAITSPMVGTAYLAPSPTSGPFTSVGGSVTEGQTVLIVEAMKTMNEIKAPKSGKVMQILARDAEPVEFGEVLMIIE